MLSSCPLSSLGGTLRQLLRIRACCPVGEKETQPCLEPGWEGQEPYLPALNPTSPPPSADRPPPHRSMCLLDFSTAAACPILPAGLGNLRGTGRSLPHNPKTWNLHAWHSAWHTGASVNRRGGERAGCGSEWLSVWHNSLMGDFVNLITAQWLQAWITVWVTAFAAI